MLILSGRGLVLVSTSKNVRGIGSPPHRVDYRGPPEFHGYAEWHATHASEEQPGRVQANVAGDTVFPVASRVELVCTGRAVTTDAAEISVVGLLGHRCLLSAERQSLQIVCVGCPAESNE